MRRTAQIPFDLPATASLARDDLVSGEANALALGAIDAWPDWPHPVVMVVGPPGAGKTHIAAAWAERAGAARFDPASANAAGERSDGGFAVVVEDIDRIGYDEGELFSLFNAARLGGGSVLATSRLMPAALPIRLPDLLSRLRAATIVELAAPDETLLFGVLMKLAADRQVELDPRLATFALSRMERSFEAAADLIGRLDREALARKGPITRSLLQSVLRQMEVECDTAS